jgi:hypothetical protein
MTVSELIEELSALPPDAEVIHGINNAMPVDRPLAFNPNAHWWNPSSGARSGFRSGPAVIL